MGSSGVLGPAPSGPDAARRGGAWGAPERVEGDPSRRRKLAVLLLLVGVVLSAISTATPWWFDSMTLTDSYTGASSSGTMEFNPGSTSYVTCTGSAVYGWSPCTSNANWAYASTGLSDLGGYYVTVHVMIVLSAVLGGICALFMIMGATRRGWGRWHFHTTHLLALIAGILTILGPALLLLVQPGLVGPIGSAPAYSGPYEYFLGAEQANCGMNTPNATFWSSCSFTVGGGGSPSAGSIQASWGAGLGWYASLGAAFAFLVGGALYLSSRPEGTSSVESDVPPYARREPPAAPWGAPGLPPGSPRSTDLASLGSDPRELTSASPLGYQGAVVVSNRTSCRSCGHLNPPGSGLCTRCHAPLG